MKQKAKKILAFVVAFMLVFTGIMPVFAANSPEIDAYFDSAYAKAIDKYGNLQKDEYGRYIIALSKTSVSLTKDSGSKLYTAVWSSGDENYVQITSDYSSSAAARINHPTAKEGDKEVVMTLTLKDKNDPTKICGTRDYVLLIAARLPEYSLSVHAKNSDGAVIENANVLVRDSRNISLRPTNGIYSLTGSTAYSITVSAPGYIRNTQTVTLTEDEDLDVVLEKGTTVNFKVKTVSGSITDFATIKVTSADSGDSYSPVLDEYDYETSVFELKPGEYKYDIKYQSDSQSASGTFTVSVGQETLEVPVQLKNTEYKVKFDVDPQDAVISLYKNGSSGAYGDPILPDENGYYTIVFGQYRYTAEAEGFTSVSKTFNATDTSLKNNNYIITVKLQSPYDKVLADADTILFSASGPGLYLNEYSGLHSDIDFGCYADIDSDYDDVKIQDTVEKYIAEKLNSDKPVTVRLAGVENDDFETDNSVIDENGIIHYDAVTDGMLNFDETGAEFTVKLMLTCENRIKESEVRVIVPKHITSRQERLDAAAAYACDFEKIKGENTDINHIEKALVLEDISSDISNDFTYYSICTQWSSDHPDIINPSTGEVNLPEKETSVTLTVKAYYSMPQIEEAGFLFDPGPLGDNESLRTIMLTVPGTNKDVDVPDVPVKDDTTKPDIPETAAKPTETDRPDITATELSDPANEQVKSPTSSVNTDTEKTAANSNTEKRSPATGNDLSVLMLAVSCSFTAAIFITMQKKRKYEGE